MGVWIRQYKTRRDKAGHDKRRKGKTRYDTTLERPRSGEALQERRGAGGFATPLGEYLPGVLPEPPRFDL